MGTNSLTAGPKGLDLSNWANVNQPAVYVSANTLSNFNF